MDIDIAGKVIVVTGAARGIGRAVALGLAVEGARVAVLARERQRAQLVVDEIEGLPDAQTALALEADVGDEAAVRRAVAETDAAWGRVDALINNAGWMPGRQPVLELELSVLERVLRSNLIGSFLTTKHFAPLMIRGGGGRIVYISSVVGVQASPGGAPYGASKAALNVLTNVAHQELADQGRQLARPADRPARGPRRVDHLSLQRGGPPPFGHGDHRAPADLRLIPQAPPQAKGCGARVAVDGGRSA